jgi:hypothetical protein
MKGLLSNSVMTSHVLHIFNTLYVTYVSIVVDFFFDTQMG